MNVQSNFKSQCTYCILAFFMELNQNVLNEFIFKLKKVLYKGIVQELKLEYCTDADGRYIYLVLINIKKSKRNAGYGSLIMSDLTQFANNHNVRIKLWATNIYGSDLNRLYGFYEKHGFVLIKTENDGNMIYYPTIR